MKKILIYQSDSKLVCHIEDPQANLPRFRDASPVAAFDVSSVLMNIE